MTETVNRTERQIEAMDLVTDKYQFDQIDISQVTHEEGEGYKPIDWRTLTSVLRTRDYIEFTVDGGEKFSCALDEWVLVRLNPDRKGSSYMISQQAEVEERYSREDVAKAMALAGYKSADHLVEYTEVARAQRLGYLRETVAGAINRDDHGKRVRVGDAGRKAQILTHVFQLESYPDVTWLVMDGYASDIKKDTPVWIDDSSTPEEN